MPEVSCPQCGLGVTIVPSLAGQVVSCPQCQFNFIMPAPPRASAPPPPPPPPPPQPVVSVYQSSVTRSFRPAKSILDVFDFRFESFVTPIIIRTTWVLALVAAFIFAAAVLFFLLVPLPSTPPPAPQETFGSRPQFETKTVIEVPEFMSEIIPKLVTIGLLTLWLVLSLLWLRVGLEMTIVVFNIATSLQSIDKKTKG